MKKKKEMPEEFIRDRFDGMYLERESENLFGGEEEEKGGAYSELIGEDDEYDEDERELSVDEMCGEIGIDADILRAVIEEEIMPQVIENARLVTARRAMQQFEDGSWEERRLKKLCGEGFELADAVEKVKNEQLKRRVKMLEKRLENRKNTTGSAYSRAKMEFDD